MIISDFDNIDNNIKDVKFENVLFKKKEFSHKLSYTTGIICTCANTERCTRIRYNLYILLQ